MATTFRTLALAACLVVPAACGDGPDVPALGSGAIRSVLNLAGTNALALDAAFDVGRDGVFLAATQSGPADYGRGAIGRAIGEPPVIAVGRYNGMVQAQWSMVLDAPFTAGAEPRLAVDTEGNLLLAVADFGGSIDLGAGPQSGSMVTQLSLADGFSRWSVSLPADGSPHPRFIVADADGSTVVASSVSTGAGGVRIDRLAPASGALLASRPLGGATGNVTLDGLGLDADGNLVVGGSFDQTLTLAAVHTQVAGQNAGYVAKIGRNSGAALWSRQLRRRAAGDRIVVAPLADGDIAVAGVFAFADDPSDTDNPAGPTIYLRLARLAGATGETVWTVRTNLPNTAALDVLDLADGTDDLLLSATFSGTLQLGGVNAVSTADSSMAVARFSRDDGAPVWLRYSSITTARAYRVGVDASGDTIGVGTFGSQSADGKALQTIFLLRVVP